MHQNHIGIGAGPRGCTHRLAAMGTSRYHCHARQQLTGVSHQFSGNDNHHKRVDPGAGDPGDTMLQNRRTAEIDKRFRESSRAVHRTPQREQSRPLGRGRPPVRLQTQIRTPQPEPRRECSWPSRRRCSVPATTHPRAPGARVRMLFSPADKPRSCSRRHRSRTISATLMMSPELSFS